MEAVAGIDRLPRALGRLFIVVGVFDGLHRGHRYLLAHLRREAARRGARPAVITFDAHPDEIILGAAPPLLCDPVERLARLRAAGVEVTVVQHFDAALRSTPYDVFVERVLERVELAGFLMTPDAAFGHERGGSPATVTALGRRLGFDVAVVPPLEIGGRPVRSQEIRADVASGELAAARVLLGRPFAVAGVLSSPGVDPAVRFDIPPALPPDGRYRVTVEPAWSAIGRIARPSDTVATIEGGTVHIPRGIAGRQSTATPVAQRLRVAFVGPADRPATRAGVRG